MKARTKLDLAALQAAVKPQPDPVAVANRDETPPVPQPQPRAVVARAAPPPKEQGTAPRAVSRRGKSGVQFWTEPATRKTLKLAALELDRSVDDIVNEAVAQWLARQGRA